MEPIFLDHNIIYSFFIRESDKNEYSVKIVESILINKEICFCSLNGLFVLNSEIINSFLNLKKRSLINKKFNINKEVSSKIENFISKLNIRIIYSTNQLILKRTLSLIEEYDISFETAYFTSLMIEQRINTVATNTSEYDTLFTEGILNKYEPVY